MSQINKYRVVGYGIGREVLVVLEPVFDRLWRKIGEKWKSRAFGDFF